MLRLGDRPVLITGAASGIGRATAVMAAASGAIVAAIDVDGPGLEETVDLVRADGGQIVSRVADVADRADLAAAISAVTSAVGPLHGSFANAAMLPGPSPVERLDWAEWDRVIATNLTGAIATLVMTVPHVVDGGSMVASGSSLAIRPRDQRLAYVGAKAGLHAAVRALALELAPRRIRANVVAPGLTDTPMVHAIPGHVDGGLPSVPLGDLAPPEEVAALVVHLISDDARHLTGAVLSIDGGRTTA